MPSEVVNSIEPQINNDSRRSIIQEIITDNHPPFQGLETRQLNLENTLYKEFFIKQTKLNKLKSKLNDEEKEWLEIYCAAQAESQISNFVQRQSEKARNKLSKRLTNEEVEEILNNQKELDQLQQQLENLQEQKLETKIEIRPLGQEVKNLGRE